MQTVSSNAQVPVQPKEPSFWKDEKGRILYSFGNYTTIVLATSTTKQTKLGVYLGSRQYPSLKELLKALPHATSDSRKWGPYTTLPALVKEIAWLQSKQ